MNRGHELAWIQEVPSAQTQAQRAKSLHTRRRHTKSRSGCLQCKRRKTKCDEGHPVCSRCQSRGLDCSYREAHAPPPPTEQAISVPQSSASDLSYEACMGTQVFATFIAQRANLSAKSGKSSNSFAYILQHFEQSSCHSITTPGGERVFHDKVPQMLTSHPFLLHSVLAFSASHLEYLSHSTGGSNEMTLIARYHTRRALDLYSSHMDVYRKGHGSSSSSSSFAQNQSTCLSPSPSRCEEIDALVAACMLLNSLFYYMQETAPQAPPCSAWILSPFKLYYNCPFQFAVEQDANWLSNMAGMLELLQVSEVRQCISQSSSCWYPVLTDVVLSLPGAEQMHGTDTLNPLHLQLEATTTTGLAKDLPALLNLVLFMKRSEYTMALSAVAPFLELDFTNLGNFRKLMPFPSLLCDDFLGLLTHMPPDPIALLIVGHMFVRMSQLPHWWCRTRGRTEARAIAWYVDSVISQSAGVVPPFMHPGFMHSGVKVEEQTLPFLESALLEFKLIGGIESQQADPVGSRIFEQYLRDLPIF